MSNEQGVEEQRPRVRVKFGTAGIRGVYGQEVSLKETIAVCFAVHQLLGLGKFGVGYDSRESSFILANATCSAMNWYGSDVENYGMIPTPVLAFNIKRNKLHAGFSVTASHNPPEYSGVKVFGTDGIEFSLEEERKLEELLQKSGGFVKLDQDVGSFGFTSDNEEALFAYRDEVLRRALPTRKKFKILVDCANGTAGLVTPFLLSQLGHQVVTINAHPAGTFPGRMPEPMTSTLGEVAELSKAIGADFCIAHDGDADRLVMIDERGSMIPDYVLSALLMRIVVERSKRGMVIISQNSSTALEKVASMLGCRVQRSRLGKTFEELYKKKGIFASEPSKIVDPSWGYWEDGMYAGVLLTQYLSSNNVSLSSVLGFVPKYCNYQKNIITESVVDYDAARRSLMQRFTGRIESIEDLDGIRVVFRDGSWLMLRSSGTERKVRVYVEAKEEGVARDLLDGAVIVAKSSCG